ncbi:hypothetical protein FAIPA1_160074 [Frankia sp. AiPs1]|uniref:hypothetical protein n=1 Tax=Frankia sp. AiPa1 TaxID=573492 RepID=UPI00202B2425|nr:hypothetical protein [Frankia sp. AiPa1]MCL9761495.1 hypothetical protein [Frankia sp. AiPa1]
MQTFGAVLVVLVLLAIPAFIVLPPLAWAYVRSGPLRVAAEAEAEREKRHGPR